MTFSLNKEQQKAVNSDNNTLVIAGAGSGKTSVLVEKVGKVLKDGYNPSGVIAITFTKMAAEEMRIRLDNTPGIQECFIGTIHAFAMHVMKTSGQNIRIYDDEAENIIIKTVMKEWINQKVIGYSGKIGFNKILKYKQLYAKVEQGLKDEKELKDLLSYVEQNDLMSLVKEAKKRRKLYGYKTFSELIDITTKFFKETGGKIEYLLVDEFQDVGYMEFNFLKSLKAKNNFFVGDDFQSIYGFSGAIPELFQKLAKDKDWSVVKLKKNYRNCKQVNDAGNMVISRVPDMIEKEVVIQNKDQGRFINDSYRALYKYLKQKVKNSTYKNWFILCRSNANVQKVLKLCLSLKIPALTFKKAGMTIGKKDSLIKQNKVKILTVHMSKGLESRNVMVYWPGVKTTPPKRMMAEEEQRILYVGITRAKTNCYLLN